MERKKVFIAIPTYDSRMHVDLARVLFEWAKQFNINLNFSHRAVPLHAARNILIERFLETDCEYIFFIDDDVVPPQNVIEELIKADKDIIMPGTLMVKPVGRRGCCPVPQCMKKVEGVDGYKPFWGEGIQETDTIGGAAFLVKREVFEKEPYKFRFTYQPNGARKKGADVCFSEDMRERGYKLYVHFALACRHIRDVDLLRIHNFLGDLQKNGTQYTGCDKKLDS